MLLIRLLLFLLILTWKVGDVADPTAPSQAERATHPLSSASPGEASSRGFNSRLQPHMFPGYNHMSQPHVSRLRPHVSRLQPHVSRLQPHVSQELAAAFLALVDLRRLRITDAEGDGGEAEEAEAAAAAAALLSAIDSRGDLALTQLDEHVWSERHLELLLLALTHNARVRALTLRRFVIGGAAAAALAVLLRHNAALRALSLEGCGRLAAYPDR